MMLVKTNRSPPGLGTDAGGCLDRKTPHFLRSVPHNRARRVASLGLLARWCDLHALVTSVCHVNVCLTISMETGSSWR